MHVRTGAPYAPSAPTDRHSGTSETESASTRHSSIEKGVGSLKLHSSPPRNRFAAGRLNRRNDHRFCRRHNDPPHLRLFGAAPDLYDHRNPGNIRQNLVREPCRAHTGGD